MNVFPRCFTTGNIIAFPYACAPGRGLTHAKLSLMSPRSQIVDWRGNFPITQGAWDDDGTAYVFPEGTITGTPPDSGPGLLDRFAAGVNRILDSGDRASGAAHMSGVALTALVGAGLLLWYIPRKKK